MNSLPILCIMLALGACAVERDATDGGDPVAAAQDSALVKAGYKPADIAEARTYLARYTKARQDECFAEPKLGGVELLEPEDGKFGVGAGVTRVVIAIDGSGSMAARIGGRSKLDLAKESTRAFIDGLGPEMDASLLVFGQQGDNSDAGKSESCAAIDQLAPMSRDRTALIGGVNQVRAVGWTPLAAALQRAQAQLVASDRPGEQVIYVVSDGNETCGGDAVAVARAINRGKTRAIVNIIGFDLPQADQAALRGVASAGGGRLVNIADDAAYQRAMAGFREAARQNINLVRARGASDRNIIDSGAARNRAVICTGGIITRETLNVAGDLNARDANGGAGPERGVVMAVLEQRHAAMRARRDAFEARLNSERDSSIDAIDAKAKAAQ